MQTGAQQIRAAPGEVLESLLAEIDEATLADQNPGLVLDPALVASLRRHWSTASTTSNKRCMSLPLRSRIS
jgi:hypothetical protein